MKERDKHINGKYMGAQGHCSGNDPEAELQLSAVDSELLDKINSYFRGYYDIKDVKSDPAYSKTIDTVNLIISQYQNIGAHNTEIEKFIREGMILEASEEKIGKEISQIKSEIKSSDVDDVSAALVKEWSARKQKEGGQDKKAEEIRRFVTASLEASESKTEIDRGPGKEKPGSVRIRIVSYISLAAAAIIGAVFIIRSLLPGSDPDKIFSKYYEPYSAVSSVTRSSGTGNNKAFESALNSYREGDYQAAATGFSAAMLNETESDSYRFFLGLTCIALNDFNRAVTLLDDVASGEGGYAKEAGWYLGLASLKTGNNTKALKCFGNLARMPGFYSERPGEILRRLK